MNIHTAAFEMSAMTAKQLPEPAAPEIVFAGRSNVGKSSVINAVLKRKGLARTSSTPGKTAAINFYKLDTVRLVDLPGYGYARVSGQEKRRWSELIESYFAAARPLRLVLLLLDMRHPPSKEDTVMLEYLTELKLPFAVALTKADKLRPTQRDTALEIMAQALRPYPVGTAIPVSAVTGEGIEAVRELLANGEQ